MPRINLSDEDADHVRRWQKLTDDQKEALNKVAKLLGDEPNRKSFYYLLENQIRISEVLAIYAHVSWAGRMFIKAGVIASVLLGVLGVYKAFYGGK